MLSTVITFALLSALVAGDDCDGSVQIHPKGNDKLCLDVQGNIQINGTPVIVYDCNGTGAQNWVLENGAVKLAGTNFCLDAGSNPGSGTSMKIWTCYDDLAAQQFTQKDNTIALGSAQQCLDMTDGNASAGQVTQTWQCYPGNENQQWTTSAAALQSHRRRSRIRKRACGSPITSVSATAAPAVTSDATGDEKKGNQAVANAKVEAAKPVTTTTTTEAAPAPAATTSAAPAPAPAPAKGNQYTPNGKKAGIAGGDMFNDLQDHIGWWYDWAPNSAADHVGTPLYIPMLWGNGNQGETDRQRLNDFYAVKDSAWVSQPPKYFLGFNEPDCDGYESAKMSVSQTVELWNADIAPLGDKGSMLISPVPCNRGDFLGQFSQHITDYDIVAVHIYANSVGNAINTLAPFKKYGKPIWVTEFGCVRDPGTDFNPCDPAKQKEFLTGMIDMFEDPANGVYAYAPITNSDQVWKLYDYGSNQLTDLGHVYLDKIKSL